MNISWNEHSKSKGKTYESKRNCSHSSSNLRLYEYLKWKRKWESIRAECVCVCVRKTVDRQTKRQRACDSKITSAIQGKRSLHFLPLPKLSHFIQKTRKYKNNVRIWSKSKCSTTINVYCDLAVIVIAFRLRRLGKPNHFLAYRCRYRVTLSCYVQKQKQNKTRTVESNTRAKLKPSCLSCDFHNIHEYSSVVG